MEQLTLPQEWKLLLSIVYVGATEQFAKLVRRPGLLHHKVRAASSTYFKLFTPRASFATTNPAQVNTIKLFKLIVGEDLPNSLEMLKVLVKHPGVDINNQKVSSLVVN